VTGIGTGNPAPTASATEFDRGLSKHVDGALGNAGDFGNVRFYAGKQIAAAGGAEGAPGRDTAGVTTFWSDDESAKRKINTAGEDAFWDTAAAGQAPAPVTTSGGTVFLGDRFDVALGAKPSDALAQRDSYFVQQGEHPAAKPSGPNVAALGEANRTTEFFGRTLAGAVRSEVARGDKFAGANQAGDGRLSVDGGLGFGGGRPGEAEGRAKTKTKKLYDFVDESAVASQPAAETQLGMIVAPTNAPALEQQVKREASRRGDGAASGLPAVSPESLASAMTELRSATSRLETETAESKQVQETLEKALTEEKERAITVERGVQAFQEKVTMSAQERQLGREQQLEVLADLDGDAIAKQVEPELKPEVAASFAKRASGVNMAKNDEKPADGERLDEYRKGVEEVKKLQAEIDNVAIGKDVRDERTKTRDAKLAELKAKEDEFTLARASKEAAIKKESEAHPAKLRELLERNKALADSEKQKSAEDSPAPKPAAPAPTPQPEIATSANAFSTFSLNVTDVSFKLAAASLEKEQMPEPATVRSEEFINAFDYRDPEPAAGAPLAFAFERARDPFAQNRDVLRLAVKTASAGRAPGRALNLVLLLDASGSMERADRVAIVREALRVLAAQLGAQDKLSVITFARTPRLWIDGASGDKAGAATARVAEITPQGGTNIEAALDLGYATARKHVQPGSINRVVLLTDGAANLGDVNPDALKAKVEAQRKKGIALDAFGVGWEGYVDALLEVLSRNGDGRYGFINSPEAAATEFAAQLAGALRVTASDVKVQVEFNPRRVTAWRQVGYARHQLTKEQFRDNTVDAAEIGAAESGNALYVIEVNPRGEGDLATVRVRFKSPGTGEYREHAWQVPAGSGTGILPVSMAPPLGQASPSLRLAATAAAFAEWLAGSPFASEVTPDALLGLMNGVPAAFGTDPRPGKLEWMIRQAKRISGK
jgi:Mg-chelatase subunit ChlD